jgi:hypothetical protein
MTLENHHRSEHVERQTPTTAMLDDSTPSNGQGPTSDRRVGMAVRAQEKSTVGDGMSEHDAAGAILTRIKAGEVLMVNSRRRNGLILCKPFHAEFAGPGAAVGSQLDLDCLHVIPVGNLSLLKPESYEECQRAFKIRRQWIKLTQQFTDQPKPLQRAQMILNQFEAYFDPTTIANIPDEAFARLVGVLPHTVRAARRPPGQVTVRVKT